MNEGFCEQVTPDHQHSQAGFETPDSWRSLVAHIRGAVSGANVGLFFKDVHFAQNRQKSPH
jgi:hypothetical protein